MCFFSIFVFGLNKNCEVICIFIFVFFDYDKCMCFLFFENLLIVYWRNVFVENRVSESIRVIGIYCLLRLNNGVLFFESYNVWGKFSVDKDSLILVFVVCFLEFRS